MLADAAAAGRGIKTVQIADDDAETTYNVIGDLHLFLIIPQISTDPTPHFPNTKEMRYLGDSVVCPYSMLLKQRKDVTLNFRPSSLQVMFVMLMVYLIFAANFCVACWLCKSKWAGVSVAQH